MAPRKSSKGKSPKAIAKKTRKRVTRAASDDLEVFIPRSSVAPVAVDRRDDDETPVFVARPGAPVVVQSDWVDDDKAYADALSALPEGHVLTQLPDMTELAELGFVRDTRALNGARCRYACGGAMSKIPNLAAHRYDCPYWQNEGKTKTPF
jgi:hypothetical protein